MRAKRKRNRLMFDEIVKEVLANPTEPGPTGGSGYLANWFDPARRGGMLRRISENYFKGALTGHTPDQLHGYFEEFILDMRAHGQTEAASRLFTKLMPITLSNGGPPLEE